jgi:hypothetical protein
MKPPTPSNRGAGLRLIAALVALLAGSAAAIIALLLIHTVLA